MVQEIVDKNVGDENKKNLWSQILSDVQNNGNPKLPSCKQVLVLGDNESGKTTIVAKLQGVEDPRKGSGLEYAYIDVRDDYRDDHTRLSVWVLDGDPGHTHLLKFALNETTFEHTLVILTVTMTAPWSILEQLQHWVAVLADHIDKLDTKENIEMREVRRQHLIRLWQDYVEPGDELDTAAASPMNRNSRTFEEGVLDREGTALAEATLTTNLGLEIVVVVTKTDYMQTLEKEHDYRDEHLDFMQQWIRRFCLQYGAALFYTSAKEDKNCDLLYKYLTHRIYGFPFRTPALVVEKDAVFIPSGWDNMNKIRILHENLHQCKAEDYYRDVIVQPVTRKSINRDNEILAEEEQTFLGRQQQILLAGGSPLVAPRLEPQLRTSNTPLGKLDGSKVVSSTGGEGVLANFFNSLLHKKTGAGGSSPGSPMLNKSGGPESLGDKATMRSDAAAELDRLARGGKKHTTTPSSGGGSGTSSANISGVDFNTSDC